MANFYIINVYLYIEFARGGQLYWKFKKSSHFEENYIAICN